MVMNYAVGLPTVGGFGDVHTLVDLAVAAEQHGWDGVHLWDHLLYHDSGWPVASASAPALARSWRGSLAAAGVIGGIQMPAAVAPAPPRN